MERFPQPSNTDSQPPYLENNGAAHYGDFTAEGSTLLENLVTEQFHERPFTGNNNASYYPVDEK
jgi:hypothetical protein